MTSIPVLCGLSAAFLQYFMLVFFALTAVEAMWLYIKLVIIFGIQSHEDKFILKSVIPAWSKFKPIHIAITVLNTVPANYFCKALDNC